jgi:hypothetical protein
MSLPTNVPLKRRLRASNPPAGQFSVGVNNLTILPMATNSLTVKADVAGKGKLKAPGGALV